MTATISFKSAPGINSGLPFYCDFCNATIESGAGFSILQRSFMGRPFNVCIDCTTRKVRESKSQTAGGKPDSKTEERK